MDQERQRTADTPCASRYRAPQWPAADRKPLTASRALSGVGSLRRRQPRSACRGNRNGNNAGNDRHARSAPIMPNNRPPCRPAVSSKATTCRKHRLFQDRRKNYKCRVAPAPRGQNVLVTTSEALGCCRLDPTPANNQPGMHKPGKSARQRHYQKSRKPRSPSPSTSTSTCSQPTRSAGYPQPASRPWCRYKARGPSPVRHRIGQIAPARSAAKHKAGRCTHRAENAPGKPRRGYAAAGDNFRSPARTGKTPRTVPRSTAILASTSNSTKEAIGL